VPTREDVLAIRSIDDAFDLSTTKIKPREVALIRVALAEGLVQSTMHELHAADDELIAERAVDRVIAEGRAASKDVDPAGPRQIGINFEGRAGARRRIRVKVSWEDGYYVVTAHSIETDE
jgi:hypothetical protein